MLGALLTPEDVYLRGSCHELHMTDYAKLGLGAIQIGMHSSLGTGRRIVGNVEVVAAFVLLAMEL